jgi:uncharacterized protein YvpB
MEYLGPVSGSPLIPYSWILAYEGALCFLLLICGYFLYRKYPFVTIRKVFVYTIGGFHLLLFLSGNAFLTVYLTPQPRAISISPNIDTDLQPNTSRLEFLFDHPVQRSILTKSIQPQIPGMWVFERPLYDTHLYRKLVFYPFYPFKLNTAYTILLSSVQNLAQKTPAKTLSYTFHTAANPPSNAVLGIQSPDSNPDRVIATGSFPQDLWTDLAVDTTIRIRFNQEVNRADAQSRFSILPPVSGTFSWDSDTMVFKPDNYLSFNTRYTFYLGSGIRNSGLTKQSLDGYAVSFTTQSEETKLNVPVLMQKYALSCEIASLRMVLSYRGVQTTEDELLSLIGSDPSSHIGNTWGNPYVGFVGSVKGRQFGNGYGVYWEPIARTARVYRPASVSFEHWDITKLTQSIQKSNPVIVWISIQGKNPTIWNTPTGDKILAVTDEHAVVVTGFVGAPNDPTHIIVNDPLTGEAYWTRQNFEKKWNSLGFSGVVVN